MCRVVPMQHAKMFILFFVVWIATAFFVALALLGHLFRLRVRRTFFQCALETFAEILKFAKCPGGRYEVLNLHLPLPFDGDSELQ